MKLRSIRSGLVTAILLCAAILFEPTRASASTLTHSTSTDFSAGSGDGQVSFTAVVNGEVSLQKLAGPLGAFSSVTALPFAMAWPQAFASDTHLYVAGMADSGGLPRNNVYSAPYSGVTLGPWTALSNLPITVAQSGLARWRDRVYLAGGLTSSASTNTVISASILPGGSLGPWTYLTPLPSTMVPVCALAAAGHLFVGTTISTQSAPILADGSLGAWSSLAGTPSGNMNSGVAYADGYFWVAGGGPGSFPFSSTAFSALVNAGGTLGAWTLQASSLPQGDTWFSTSEADGAGKFFIAGGRTGNFGPWATTQIYSSSFSGGGNIAAWVTETEALPSARSAGSVIVSPGALWYLGGVNSTPAYISTVYVSAFAGGPANAHEGRYANGFDVGSLVTLNSLTWNSNVPANVSARARTADASMVFGAWSAYSGSPLALGVNGRYVEYEFRLADPGSGLDLRLEDVSLDYAAFTPTATTTPTVTPTPTATPSASPTVTETPTASPSATASPSQSSTPTLLPTGTVSSTATISPTFTQTQVVTATTVPKVGVQLFPNPFHPDRGETFHLGNLAPGLRVNIYNIIGESVIGFYTKGNPTEDRWDGLNANGVRVVTGVYFLQVDGKVYRLAVVRN